MSFEDRVRECSEVSESAGYYCTLAAGHEGDVHVAQASGGRVVWVWKVPRHETTLYPID